LDVLRKRDVADKAVFSARAYAKVISQLKTETTPITSFEDVRNIEGIGTKMEKKIKEILETGYLVAAEKAKELYDIDALDTLQNIYGIGPAKATELVKSGIKGIVDLREAVKRDPTLINDKQKIGLKYYEDLLERIPRTEMNEHRDVLHSLLPADMEEYTIEIVGSYRREAPTSGDIDVLIRMPVNTTFKDAKSHLAEYVKMLKGFGYIEEVLALGEHKCMAISRIYKGKARRLDLLMTPANEYAYSLLYFTGSDKFNVAFRQYALNKGYTLNEHTLTRIKHEVQEVPSFMATEKDIFNFLGLRYIEPSCRIDSEQVIPKTRKPTVGKIQGNIKI